ncbi:MAG: Rrf2 family transcriptional regulator [Victivallales bacterium]
MKISTRARYGARLMFQLALDYGKGLSLLRNIAKKEELSEKYLSLIVIPLKAQNLIVSGRGAKGGYMLAKAPALITMKEIVETLDGEVSVSECIGNPKKCGRFPGCITRDVWKILDEKIQATLEAITLQDLVDKYNMEKNPSANYEI